MSRAGCSGAAGRHGATVQSRRSFWGGTSAPSRSIRTPAIRRQADRRERSTGGKLRTQGPRAASRMGDRTLLSFDHSRAPVAMAGAKTAGISGRCDQDQAAGGRSGLPGRGGLARRQAVRCWKNMLTGSFVSCTLPDGGRVSVSTLAAAGFDVRVWVGGWPNSEGKGPPGSAAARGGAGVRGGSTRSAEMRPAAGSVLRTRGSPAGKVEVQAFMVGKRPGAFRQGEGWPESARRGSLKA